ncbi:MAG: hypothetical protein K6T33_06855 [Thermomonas hydrothermalis]|uniref:hypothetical protein n=1 Tax=Thermomonas hydrothermalis TaxID=213588 RepID=UPI002352BD60|nr:hypothetical protein [Thermomonas hydrothermalis]MCL6619495.1 hypothetical protein [Thermomonas hydrothermalis]
MTDFDPRGIAITPVTVGDLPAFLAAIEPIAAEVASGDILGALMRHADAVIAATAIGARVERAWLEQQTPDVLVELAGRVLEANADFFVQRVMPALTAASERIAKIASGGTPGWPGSSAPGSAIGT